MPLSLGRDFLGDSPGNRLAPLGVLSYTPLSYPFANSEIGHEVFSVMAGHVNTPRWLFAVVVLILLGVFGLALFHHHPANGANNCEWCLMLRSALLAEFGVGLVLSAVCWTFLLLLPDGPFLSSWHRSILHERAPPSALIG